MGSGEALLLLAVVLAGLLVLGPVLGIRSALARGRKGLRSTWLVPAVCLAFDLHAAAKGLLGVGFCVLAACLTLSWLFVCVRANQTASRWCRSRASQAAAANAPATIVHRQWRLHFAFSAQGLTYYPVLGRPPIAVAWSEIDFVSPIPAPERVGAHWQFKDFGFARGHDTLRDYGLLTLDIVIRDRHTLGPRFRGDPFPLRALGGIGDELHPTQGVFEISLRIANLDAAPCDLLELFARYTRFDLLVRDD